MTDYFKYKKIIVCHDTGENCIGYQKYLKSKHWITLRNAIINESTVCAVCGEKNTPLQLHHKTYERIGRERINDVIPLCNNCHKLVHSTDASKFLSKLNTTKNTTKKKRPSKSKRKICKNCRSFAIMKYEGKMRPVCRYFSKPTERSKKACNKFGYKKRITW